MLLVIDIGNTQISLGLYKNKKLLFTSRIATIASYTSDQYAVELKNILALYGFEPCGVTGAMISSVVPAVGDSVKAAVTRICSITPLIVGPGIKSGLNIKIDNPAQLGGDLVVAAVAAVAIYRLPAIIFDFGTATKISVVDKNSNFLGCAITAGIHISIDALVERTAALPPISINMPRQVIGTNSAESMKSGLIYGAAAMIDGMAERIESELEEEAELLLTGGLARFINGHSKRKVIYCDTLLLEGLRILYERNQAK